MTTGEGRRRPKRLSAETKWEIYLQVASGAVTQADAARKWGVDVSTVITIRRTVKDAALAALVRRGCAHIGHDSHVHSRIGSEIREPQRMCVCAAV